VAYLNTNSIKVRFPKFYRQFATCGDRPTYF
jgi:hypothetical protein